MNALDVRELTKVYPAFTLDHISFSVPEKHVVGLIGRNGAGKSTAIKSILRFVSSQGAVRVFGKDMEENEREIKQEIGYVGGGFRYYPLKTLAAVRRAYSAFYPMWDAKKYGDYLGRFALDERKKVRELSEGMKVKFALALALSHGAKLLIMDEPTSGLDPLSREEFCDIVLGLVRTEGISVCFPRTSPPTSCALPTTSCIFRRARFWRSARSVLCSPNTGWRGLPLRRRRRERAPWG